jgi:hypothetical protein
MKLSYEELVDLAVAWRRRIRDTSGLAAVREYIALASALDEEIARRDAADAVSTPACEAAGES